MNYLKMSFFTTLLALIATSAFAADSETTYLNERLSPVFKNTLTKSEMSSGKTVDRDKKLVQCFRDDMVASEIINGALKDVKQNLLDKKDGMFAQVSSFPGATGKADQNFDGIALTKLTAQTLNSSYKSYSSSFDIKDITFSVIDMSMPTAVRDEKMNPSEVTLLTRFDFRGVDAKNNKRQDRGMVEMTFKKDGDRWTFASMLFKSGESLTSAKEPSFRKLASNDLSVPVKLRTEAIRRGGYALSNADVNNDGYMDLLVANRDGLQLYMGKKDGGLELKKDSGLDSVSYVKTAVFADLNNSGHKDLVLTRLTGKPIAQANGKQNLSVFVFQGDGTGKFTMIPKAINADKKKFLESMPATVADFNGDGYLDIYVGYPGIKDFTADRNENLKDYSPQGVYLNKGNFKFDDFTDRFVDSDYQGGKLFPHASIAANFDQKNGVDLLVADDRGNLSPAFLNNGKSFKESAEVIGVGNRGYGMSIAVGDVNNDGITDILFTNVNMAAAERMSKYCARQYDLAKSVDGGEAGLRLFVGSANGKFDEIPGGVSGLADAGYGAAGVTFIDYNHDGLQDIYMVNGLWSGTQSGDEQDSLFTISTTMKNDGVIHALKEEAYGGYKTFLYKAAGLFNYKTDKWEKKEGVRPSLAGYQHNRLFRNNGNGTFTEVAYFEGLDSIADGYVVAKSDINHSGVEGLILRNSDPGTNEYSYSPVEVYVNQAAAKDHAVQHEIAMRFEGKASTRDAYGTFIVVKREDGKKEVHHLVSNSGAVQDEAVIRLYLGKANKAKEIAVHWTSGKVQTLTNVTPGNYMVKEGQALTRAISSL